MTRRGAFFTGLVVVLAALAAPIVLRSHMSAIGKVLLISVGTTVLVLRTAPWRLK